MTGPEPPAMPDQPDVATTVFLSYSRADTHAMLQIARALELSGCRSNYDTAQSSADDVDIGISAQDEWWRRLQDMIVASEVMVLLVSPDSAASKVVDEEIAYARSLGKRVVPVLVRPVDFAIAPPRLASLNVRISFVDRAPDAFTAAIAALRAAIDQDIAWLRSGRVLTQKVQEWETASRGRDRLLYGVEIAEAEVWSARRPRSAPPVAEQLLDYIAQSRAWEQERLQVERRQLARQRAMQRRVGALVAAALVITLVGAGFVLERQRALSRAESVMLARVAQELYTQGDHARALRLAVLGMTAGWLQPGSDEAADVYARSMRSPMLERELATQASVTRIWSSEDGKVAAVVDGGEFGLWDVASQARLASTASSAKLSDVGFDVAAGGREFIVWGKDLDQADAFEDGVRSLGAMVASTWQLDDAGKAVAGPWRSLPIEGALFAGGQAVLGWGASTLGLWSRSLERRLFATRLVAPVEAVRVFGDGKRAVVALAGGRVELWALDAIGKRPMQRLASASSGRTARDIVVMPAAGMLLLITEANEIVAMDAGTLKVRYRGVAQQCCTRSPETKLIPVAGRRVPALVLLTHSPDNKARRVLAETGAPIGSEFMHQGLSGASFDATGARIVTFGVNAEAYIWDAASGAKLASIDQFDLLGSSPRNSPPGGITGARFTADGRAVLVWGRDGTLRVHDASTGRQIGGHMRHPFTVLAAIPLPGQRLMTASSGPVRIWQLPEYGAPVPSVDALCRSNWPDSSLVRLFREERGGAALSVSMREQGANATLAPALQLDDEDVRNAPILRGRIGQSVCGRRAGG